MSIHDSIRINELNSELAALKDKLVMTVEAWETTTNSFINFYVSEREARFVFSTLESRDAFMKVMIGAENTIDNATAEDVARHRAKIEAKCLEDAAEHFTAPHTIEVSYLWVEQKLRNMASTKRNGG